MERKKADVKHYTNIMSIYSNKLIIHKKKKLLQCKFITFTGLLSSRKIILQHAGSPSTITSVFSFNFMHKLKILFFGCLNAPKYHDFQVPEEPIKIVCYP